MSTTLKLRIETREEMEQLMESLYERKLIPGYYYLKESIQKATYPIEVPLDVDTLLDMVFKPAIVKMFGNKIRPNLIKGLETVVKGT